MEKNWQAWIGSQGLDSRSTSAVYLLCDLGKITFFSFTFPFVSVYKTKELDLMTTFVSTSEILFILPFNQKFQHTVGNWPIF